MPLQQVCIQIQTNNCYQFIRPRRQLTIHLYHKLHFMATQQHIGTLQHMQKQESPLHHNYILWPHLPKSDIPSPKCPTKTPITTFPLPFLYTITYFYHFNNCSPHCLSLFLCQVFKNVTVFMLQKLECHGKMVIFKNRLIIVHECHFRI